MDSKKRIAIIGAGQSLGQHLAHRDQLDALRMALLSNGVKAHEEADRIVEAWRAGPGRELAEPWKKAMTDCERLTHWVGFDPARHFADLSAIEDRILFDEAHHPVRRGEFVDLDFAVYKAEGRGFGYWPQFMGRAHRLQNLPALPHRKPDRQPRGKAFKRMIKLGYQWSGKR